MTLLLDQALLSIPKQQSARLSKDATHVPSMDAHGLRTLASTQKLDRTSKKSMMSSQRFHNAQILSTSAHTQALLVEHHTLLPMEPKNHSRFTSLSQLQLLKKQLRFQRITHVIIALTTLEAMASACTRMSQQLTLVSKELTSKKT